MIYFDNAATTPLHPEVKMAMTGAMELFGNPTSVHSFGRESRVFIEDQRSLAASLLGIRPSEIYFTSGGTESLQTALTGAVRDLGVKQIITSPLEHHAVLHNLQAMAATSGVQIVHAAFDSCGRIDTGNLEQLLRGASNSLVALMHANNETGMLLPLEDVAALCKRHHALFLTDTVQTTGKYRLSLPEGISFAAASAHKFHGPKGTGFMYINSDNPIKPLILGGGQERSMRSGTENIMGIAGITKALEVALRDLDTVKPRIENLREALLKGILELVPDARIITNIPDSLYTIMNVGFPNSAFGEMLLYRLDIEGIAVSGGSACNSGVSNPSHVLLALGAYEHDFQYIRFSFSRFNTPGEAARCLEILGGMVRKQ